MGACDTQGGGWICISAVTWFVGKYHTFTLFFLCFLILCLLLWPGKSRASRCEVSRVPIVSDLVCWSISQSCPTTILASNTWTHVFLFETLPFGNMVWLVGASVSDLVCWKIPEFQAADATSSGSLQKSGLGSRAADLFSAIVPSSSDATAIRWTCETQHFWGKGFKGWKVFLSFNQPACTTRS